jgi:hypothetical protein
MVRAKHKGLLWPATTDNLFTEQGHQKASRVSEDYLLVSNRFVRGHVTALDGFFSRGPCK